MFELMQTAVKPYPSCRYGHAGIDAALALRAELGLRAEEIETRHLGLSQRRHDADRRAGRRRRRTRRTWSMASSAARS